MIKDHTDLEHSQILPGCTQDGRHQAIFPIKFVTSPLALDITTSLNLCYFDRRTMTAYLNLRSFIIQAKHHFG